MSTLTNSFPGHAGRPGERGGSVAKLTPNHTGIFSVEGVGRVGEPHGRAPHGRARLPGRTPEPGRIRRRRHQSASARANYRRRRGTAENPAVRCGWRLLCC